MSNEPTIIDLILVKTFLNNEIAETMGKLEPLANRLEFLIKQYHRLDEIEKKLGILKLEAPIKL